MTPPTQMLQTNSPAYSVPAYSPVTPQIPVVSDTPHDVPDHGQKRQLSSPDSPSPALKQVAASATPIVTPHAPTPTANPVVVPTSAQNQPTITPKKPFQPRRLFADYGQSTSLAAPLPGFNITPHANIQQDDSDDTLAFPPTHYFNIPQLISPLGSSPAHQIDYNQQTSSPAHQIHHSVHDSPYSDQPQNPQFQSTPTQQLNMSHHSAVTSPILHYSPPQAGVSYHSPPDNQTSFHSSPVQQQMNISSHSSPDQQMNVSHHPPNQMNMSHHSSPQQQNIQQPMQQIIQPQSPQQPVQQFVQPQPVRGQPAARRPRSRSSSRGSVHNFNRRHAPEVVRQHPYRTRSGRMSNIPKRYGQD